MGHPSWECSRANSLNFGVPTEPEASELPKGLVLLGRDENIHIRLTRSIPLGDVGSYNPPPLGVRRPLQHTSGQGLALIPNCHIPTRAPPHPGLDSIIARYCPLWAPTKPSRFCFWELTQNFPMGHPLWECSRANSLNFGVPTEPEASELPKGLVLGRNGNIHIRLT